MGSTLIMAYFFFWTGARCTGKKTPGGAGTHTGHTGHTGARGQTDHTDEPHNRPPKPKDTNPHENRDNSTGSKFPQIRRLKPWAAQMSRGYSSTRHVRISYLG